MAMLRAMDSAVAGLRAHQSKMDVIGNNIANVNTWGFKSQSYNFKEALYQTATASTKGNADNTTTTSGGVNAAQYGYGSLTGSISTDMTASVPSYVGGLNASINGEGFFITMPTLITDPDAGVDIKQDNALKNTGFQYTRVGQFQIDANGYLQDLNGNYVYGFRTDDGKSDTIGDFDKLVPLRVPTTGGTFSYDHDEQNLVLLKSVSIDQNGMIKGMGEDDQGETVSFYLGKVGLAYFQNPNGLTKNGGGYYTANLSDNSGDVTAAAPGGTSNLMAGYIETSNVDLAKEFSEMITTQRGFQANSKIITVSDEMLSDLISMKR